MSNEVKKHKAREYQLAIESIGLLTKHAQFYIKSKKHAFDRTFWELRVMGKNFVGYDFIEVVHNAVVFVMKAYDVIPRAELDKLLQDGQEEKIG